MKVTWRKWGRSKKQEKLLEECSQTGLMIQKLTSSELDSKLLIELEEELWAGARSLSRDHSREMPSSTMSSQWMEMEMVARSESLFLKVWTKEEWRWSSSEWLTSSIGLAMLKLPKVSSLLKLSLSQSLAQPLVLKRKLGSESWKLRTRLWKPSKWELLKQLFKLRTIKSMSPEAFQLTLNSILKPWRRVESLQEEMS